MGFVGALNRFVCAGWYTNTTKRNYKWTKRRSEHSINCIQTIFIFTPARNFWKKSSRNWNAPSKMVCEHNTLLSCEFGLTWYWYWIFFLVPLTVRSMDKECAKVKSKKKCPYTQSAEFAGVQNTEKQTVRDGICPTEDVKIWECLKSEGKNRYSNDNILTPVQYEQLSIGAWGMNDPRDSYKGNNYVHHSGVNLYHTTITDSIAQLRLYIFSRRTLANGQQKQVYK